MPKLFIALIIAIHLLLPQDSIGQKQIVKDLREEYPASKMYFFYPSTLRMLNFNKNPDYYKLILQVDLMVLVNIDKTDTTYKEVFVENAIKEIENGLYENLFELSHGRNRSSFFLKETDGKPSEMFGIWETGDEYFVAYVDGYFDISALISLLKSDFDFTGFNMLLQTDNKK